MQANCIKDRCFQDYTPIILNRSRCRNRIISDHSTYAINSFYSQVQLDVHNFFDSYSCDYVLGMCSKRPGK